jgi:ankyrin repeat protein
MSDEALKITYTVDDLKTIEAINSLQYKCESIDPLWDYNSNDSEGYTPLCFAAMNGIKPDKLVYLIKNNGCNINKKCGKGKTPLQCAILSGCSESVNALIGNDVYVYDDITEDIVEDKNSEADLQPKRDAAGNPIPARDDEDNIKYIKDANGVVYPLDPSKLKDPSSVTAEPVTQQLGRLVKDGEVFPIPPELVDYNIVYKYEDGGMHSPMRDDEGNPIKQCNADGSEIHKKDEEGKDIRNKFEYVWDYEYQPEYAIAYNNKTTKINTSAIIVNADLSEAAKLPKSDVLKALGNKHKELHPAYNYAEIIDQYKITLLYSACMMSCYASVDYIFDVLVTDPTNRVTYITKQCGADEDKTALEVAIENEDEMLVEKLCHYLNITVLDNVPDDVPDNVFEAAFAHEWHSVVNALLLYVVTSDSIYDWLNKSYSWGSSHESRSIVKYIEYEHDDRIYDLLLQKYDISKLTIFTSSQCYHIIAYLYKKNIQPFNNGNKFNILTTDSRLTSVCDGVVAVLFSDG